METRRRANTRASMGIDRPYTKKERESLGKTATCPPLSKKCLSKLHLHNIGKEFPTPLSFKKKGTLDSSYNNKLDVPYISQVFNLMGMIGEGSFGVVYKAVSKVDLNVYAIKVSKQRGIKEMIKEVEKLEKIGDHPNFVKYISAWKEMGNVFIQFEYCTISLAKYSRYNHRIVEMELWAIFLDMVLALNHLHSKGFVHLDIKPDNILISHDGIYKLGDFGLLVDLLEMKNNKTRADKISEGDAKYLAREILEGQYSPAADMFSLGITILELAADLVLPTNGHLWHSLRNGEIPAEYLSTVPYSLQKLICQLMWHNYKKRPTAEELLNWRDIKRRLSKRITRPRYNYYQEWLSRRRPEDPIPEPDDIIDNSFEIERIYNNNNFTSKKLDGDYKFNFGKISFDKGCNSTFRQLNFEQEDYIKDDKSDHDTEAMIVDDEINFESSSREESSELNSSLSTPESMQTNQNSSESINSTPNHMPAKRVSKMILFSL